MKITPIVTKPKISRPPRTPRRKSLDSLGFLISTYWNCNICGDKFMQSTKFDRFCDSCRSDNELYRHAEWAAYTS